jgi:hypothetical protein
MRTNCLLPVFFCLDLAACATDPRVPRYGLNSSGGAGEAAVMTAIAATSAVASRAEGNCYAACPNGTTCNRGTGLCDPLPCRGLCAVDESCDMSQMIHRCVKRPNVQVDLKLVSPARAAPPSTEGTVPTDAPVAPK